MSRSQRNWAVELVYFWFVALDQVDWFSSNPETDARLTRRFSGHHRMLRLRPVRSFLVDAHTALAAVLLFDQLPRNIYRGSAQAFVTDSLARRIARGALARGYDRQLGSATKRQFLAMPLMHSEHIADQRLGLAIYRGFGRPNVFRFARQHHTMIARFGRFPHRNAAMGRPSTQAEQRAVAAGFAW